MGRIGVTLSGIERSLLNRLAEANAAATLSSLRMATGSMINSAAADPSGFVRLSGLQSQLNVVRSTMANVTAAGSMVTQMQSTIDAVRTQLGNIRTELLNDEDGTLTATERAEAQANIDAAIQQINTLAGTHIDGRRLLDGSANFSITGHDADQVSDVRVYSTGGSRLTVAGSVAQAATQAGLTYNGIATAKVELDATFTLTGELGTVEFSVTQNEALSDVATRINNSSHKTGVTAAVSGDDLVFSSVEYGSDVDATIAVGSGTFIVAAGNSTTDSGTDAQATINGRAYTGRGKRISVTENGVHYDLDLYAGYTGELDTITVDGDALTFALSTDLARTSTLAIPGLQAQRLGGPSGRLGELASGGTLDDLGNNTSQAIRVVDEALAELTVIEGAVDGFYNASIGSASTLLSDLEADLETAIDDVDLVDAAEQTQLLADYRNLASNSIAGLALLREQQASIVNLLQVIAGLT